jgi:hypothetical protein
MGHTHIVKLFCTAASRRGGFLFCSAAASRRGGIFVLFSRRFAAGGIFVLFAPPLRGGKES